MRLFCPVSQHFLCWAVHGRQGRFRCLKFSPYSCGYYTRSEGFLQILPFCKLRGDWEGRVVLGKVAEEPWFEKKQAEKCKVNLTFFAKRTILKLQSKLSKERGRRRYIPGFQNCAGSGSFPRRNWPGRWAPPGRQSHPLRWEGIRRPCPWRTRLPIFLA